MDKDIEILGADLADALHQSIKKLYDSQDVDAGIQDRRLTLERMGLRVEIIDHIEAQARGGLFPLLIMDDYINALRVTETSAAAALLNRLLDTPNVEVQNHFKPHEGGNRAKRRTKKAGRNGGKAGTPQNWDRKKHY